MMQETCYANFMKAITGKDYHPNFELIPLIDEWLSKMHRVDSLICCYLFGLRGFHVYPIAKVAGIIKVRYNVEFMGIGKIRERLSKLRLSFNRPKEGEKLIDLFSEIQKHEAR